MATDEPVVVANATGCLEVTTTIFPYTAWNVPFIHSAFENAAATISGVEAAYQSLKRQGKIRPTRRSASSPSAATAAPTTSACSRSPARMERGHRMLYVCYDNEAYMNTGIQRSSATPLGANTTTSPAGKVDTGQGAEPQGPDRDHGRPQHPLRRPGLARQLAGPGDQGRARPWRSTARPSSTSSPPATAAGARSRTRHRETCALAVDTCFWPLYEVENGKYKITYKPKEKPRSSTG